MKSNAVKSFFSELETVVSTSNESQFHVKQEIAMSAKLKPENKMSAVRIMAVRSPAILKPAILHPSI